MLAEQQSVRAYPRPYGVNLAHVLGYLSPITEDELDQARDGRGRVGQRRVGRSAAPAWSAATTAGCAGCPATAAWPSTRWAGCWATTGWSRAAPGDTLVTSIDARVQSIVERQLAGTIRTARRTYDEVTHRNYVADSGAVVVMEARHRAHRRDGQPADVRPAGLGRRASPSAQLAPPLLRAGRDAAARPGHPGPVRARVDVEADHERGCAEQRVHPDTRLDCSSGLQVGNRWFKNYESASYGSIGFAEALQISCDTFFYRVGLHFWQKYGSDPTDVDARDPLVEEAKHFGFGAETGIDLPGRGVRPDRRPALEARVLPGDEGLLLRARRGARRRLPAPVRPRVLPRGQLLPRRRRGQLLHRPGRHDRHPAAAGPRLRRALATAARCTSRGSARRSSAPTATCCAGSSPKVAGHVHGQPGLDALRRPGAARHRQGRHHGLADDRLPARPGPHPLQDRVGRGPRQAVDLVGGVVRRELRRRDDGQPGRHRLGHVRPGGAQDLGGAVRRPRRTASTPRRAAIPGVVPPRTLPTFIRDGSILPPVRGRHEPDQPTRATPGLDWVLLGAVVGLLGLGVLLVWSATAHREALIGGDPRAYLSKQPATSRSAWC